MKVSRRSISDHVCDAVRDMVMSGELRPGDPVTQEQLAETLGVSTMPVREALQRLSFEGILNAHPGKSFRVASFSREDLRDIYWIHATIEAELTRRAALARDSALVPALEEIHAKWIPGEVPTEQLFVLNRDFHRLINRAAGAPKLSVLLRNTLNYIPQNLYLGISKWAELSVPAHRAIIDALAARSPKRAAAAASAHVLESGELLIEHFDSIGYWQNDPSE